MLLSAYTPAYFPWPGVFSRAAKSDVLVLLDTVEFSHGDIVNRNRIKTANGVQWLTVPVAGSKNQRICDIEIVGQGVWRRKHEETIKQAYARANYPVPDFFRIPQATMLAAIAEWSMRWLMERLDIHVDIVRTSGVKSEAKGSKLILDLCERLGATEYLCGIRGGDYLDLGLFRKAGVKATVEEYQPKPYPQLHGDFIPGLSALDLVLNCGPKAKDYL